MAFKLLANGSFLLDSFQPAVEIRFRRSPDYFINDRPFIDVRSIPIIAENAQGKAKFRAERLDPKGPEMGDPATYCWPDPKEAKSLMAAAGFPNGLEVRYIFTINAYGECINQWVEAVTAMLKEGASARRSSCRIQSRVHRAGRYLLWPLRWYLRRTGDAVPGRARLPVQHAAFAVAPEPRRCERPATQGDD